MNKTVLAASLAVALAFCGAAHAGNAPSPKSPWGHGVPAAPGASATPVAGPVTQVNTTTAGDQEWRASGALDDGGYLVVWGSNTGTASDANGLHLQRFDSAGKKVGAETRLALTVVGSSLSLAVLTDGSIVAAYLGSRNAQGRPVEPPGTESGVFIQKFDASGAQVLRETAVTKTRGASTVYESASVVALADGDFVVGWTSNSPPASAQRPNFSAQRYDSDGRRSGSPVVLSRLDAGGRWVAGYTVQDAPDGGFLLVRSVTDTVNGSPCGPRSAPIATSAVHYDQNLVPRQVLAPTGCARVLALKDGNYMVVQVGKAATPTSQLVDANGALIGPQKALAARTEPFGSTALFEAQQVLADGSYLLVWDADYRFATGLNAQRYSAQGDPLGDAVTGLGVFPRGLLALADGDALLAGYASDPQDPATAAEVYTQRLAVPDAPAQGPGQSWRKQCHDLAQAHGLKSQAKKSFMDRCCPGRGGR